MSLLLSGAIAACLERLLSFVRVACALCRAFGCRDLGRYGSCSGELHSAHAELRHTIVLGIKMHGFRLEMALL